MRRDDDIIRKLMLDMEDDPSPLHTFVIEDGRELEYFHMRLLADEGFVEETGRSGGVFRMTNKGHDFVVAIRDDTVWNKTKEAAAKVSGISLSLMKDIAIGYIRQHLTNLGIPLG